MQHTFGSIVHIVKNGYLILTKVVWEIFTKLFPSGSGACCVLCYLESRQCLYWSLLWSRQDWSKKSSLLLTDKLRIPGILIILEKRLLPEEKKKCEQKFFTQDWTWQMFIFPITKWDPGDIMVHIMLHLPHFKAAAEKPTDMFHRAHLSSKLPLQHSTYKQVCRLWLDFKYRYLFY